jgi:hypothetical protein
VSYEDFVEMVKEMNHAVLRYKWLSMVPSQEDGTVSLVSKVVTASSSCVVYISPLSSISYRCL